MAKSLQLSLPSRTPYSSFLVPRELKPTQAETLFWRQETGGVIKHLGCRCRLGLSEDIGILTHSVCNFIFHRDLLTDRFCLTVCWSFLVFVGDIYPPRTVPFLACYQEATSKRQEYYEKRRADGNNSCTRVRQIVGSCSTNNGDSGPPVTAVVPQKRVRSSFLPRNQCIISPSKIRLITVIQALCGPRGSQL